MKIPGHIPNVSEKMDHSVQNRQRNGETQKSFSSILSEATTPEVQSPKPVMPGMPVAEPVHLKPVQDSALAVGQQVLDLLDHLSTLLNDPDFSQGKAKPLAEAISGQVDQLNMVRNELDKDDPLRETIDRIRVLSLVESIKLSRGDYSG